MCWGPTGRQWKGKGREGEVRNEAWGLSPQPRSKFTHISALLRFLASVMISWSRTETSSGGGGGGPGGQW